MGRLYGELAAGATLDSAVAAGRKDVLNKPQRPSPKGDKPLQDWLVPVLYQQESYTPFIPTTTDIDVLDMEAFLEPTVSNLVGFPEEGAYGFIGRDYDILRLERARRHLPFLALFSERVDADWFHAFSSSPDNSYGQAYQAFFEENLQKADWHSIGVARHKQQISALTPFSS